MSTQEILKTLINGLYRESSQRLNFRINKYGDNQLIAEDGTLLGKIVQQYDTDSIFNRYGQHGSRYAAESIFNKYGQYGGKYSSQSPFNKYTATPPKIFIDGRFIGRLSMNKYAPNAIPTDLFIYRVLTEFNFPETTSNYVIERLLDQIG